MAYKFGSGIGLGAGKHEMFVENKFGFFKVQDLS